MADEAVVRILLDDSGAKSTPSAPTPPQSQVDEALVKALREGSAMPYAPPGQAIPLTPGMDRSQADWVRMEAEAARRGMSVKDYKRAEVEAAAGGAQVPAVATPPPPPAPTQPPQPTAVEPEEDDYETRRRKREADRAKQDAEEQAELERREAEFLASYNQQNAEVEAENTASAQVDTEDDFERRRKEREEARAKQDAEEQAELERREAEFHAHYDQQNAEVEAENTSVVEVGAQTTTPPHPAPTQTPTSAQVPTTEATPNQTTDEDKLRAEITRREASNPQPGSAMGKRLADLKAELSALQKKSTAEVDADKAQTEAFDPVALAKKRIEQEERRRQVEAEYRKLKPQKPSSAVDNALESMEAMRGSVAAIGGTFGRILGVVLDVSANVRRIRAARAAASEEAAPAEVTPAPSATPVKPPPTAQIAPQAPAAAPIGAGGTPPAAVPVAAGTAPNAPVAKMAPTPPTAQPVPQATPIPTPPTAAVVPTSAAPAATAASGGLAAAAPYVAIAAVAVGAIKTLTEALNRAADKYAEYNPELAQAQAMADIRKVMGDMRRAQQHGPELAKFIKEQSEMQQRYEDIKMKIMMQITPVISQIMTAVSDLLGIASDDQYEDIEDPASIILHKDREAEIRKGLDLPGII